MSTLAFRPSLDLSRLALPVVAGLGVGVLTSVGQTYLGGPLNALVNSASAWLVGPFLVGAAMRSDRGAALAGFAACLLQLVGYTVVSELRGFSSVGAIVVFWAVCALFGGPVFGLAGRLWSSGTGDVRGVGGAVLAAAFLAEGLWLYAHELRYYDTAALWLFIGLAVAAGLLRGIRQWRWLPILLVVGLVGQVALTQVYAQSF